MGFRVSPFSEKASRVEPSRDLHPPILGVLGRTRGYSGVLGRTRAYSGVLGRTRAYSGVLGRTRAHSGVLGLTRAYSSVLGRTRAYSGVFGRTRAAVAERARNAKVAAMTPEPQRATNVRFGVWGLGLGGGLGV